MRISAKVWHESSCAITAIASIVDRTCSGAAQPMEERRLTMCVLLQITV